MKFLNLGGLTTPEKVREIVREAIKLWESESGKCIKTLHCKFE